MFRHSKDYSLELIKQSAKSRRVTINDYLSAVLSQATARYLEGKNQVLAQINVSMPVNIRF